MTSEYKQILDCPNYGINGDGEVINLLTKKKLRHQKYRNGYTYFHLIDTNGKAVTRTRHRLLMMAFKPVVGMENMVVDHINGIKGDDRLPNLRWISQQHNCESAGEMKLSSKCKPISTLNTKTGEEIHYPSATTCAIVHKCSKDTILLRVQLGEDIIFPDGFRYRYKDLTRPWRPVDQRRVERYYQLLRQPLTALHLPTGKQHIYQNLYLASKGMKRSPRTFFKRLMDQDQPIIPGGFIVQSGKPKPWRECDYYKELSQDRKLVEVYDLDYNVYEIFETHGEAQRQLNLSYQAIVFRAKSHGNKIFEPNRLFGYYPDLYNKLKSGVEVIPHSNPAELLGSPSGIISSQAS